MQTVIVSGGYGTRVKHLLGEKPKSLANISGDPFLSLQLCWLRTNNIHLCLYYKADQILEELKELPLYQILQITYEIEKKPLGVIGALRNSIDFLDCNFGVLLGDVLPNVEFSSLYNQAKPLLNQGKSVMFIAKKNSKPGQKGNVLIGSNCRIEYSKDSIFNGSHVDIGYWFLQKEHLIEFGSVLHEEPFFKKLIQNNLLAYIEIPYNSWEVGSEEGLNDIINNKDDIIYSLVK